MINVDHHVNAVRRQVGRRTIESGEAHVVVVSRTYDTGIDDLWEACTTADRLARWIGPVTGDLRLGGRYQLEGNAGGEVLRCEPPAAFDITWEFGGGTSWVEVRLTAEGADRTRFTLSHIAEPSEHWEQYGPGAVGIGWDEAVMGLALHLAARADGTDAGGPDAVALGQEFAASPDATRFTTLSGEAWRVADVEGGEDPEVAAAAAKRTVEAYTGMADGSPEGGPGAEGIDPE